MPTTRRTVPTVGALAALVAIALVITLTLSCGGDDAPPDDPPPTTAAVTTTTTSVESEVEAAYTAYLRMSDRLLQAPDPSDPEIPRLTTGRSLDALIRGLKELRDANQAVEFGDQYTNEIQSVELVDENNAVIRDCAIDDSRVVDQTTGEVVAEGIATGLFEVSLTRQGGHWRVTDT